MTSTRAEKIAALRTIIDRDVHWPSEKRALRALLADLEAGEQGAVWRHKKRGTTYTVIGRAELQSSMPIPEGHQVEVYRCLEDGSLWVRPPAEFYDGRFERLPQPPAAPKEPQ